VLLSDALGFLPEVRLDSDAARRAAHGVRVDAIQTATASEGVTVRLTDADGLIALAEPVDGGAGLKPIVGFRG
jgi:hypothetical protein